MKCNNCGSNIEYSTTKCPICGAKLDSTDMPLVYPAYVCSKTPKKLNLSLLFFVIATSLALIIGIVFAFIPSPNLWIIPTILAIYLVYCLVFVTFKDKYIISIRAILTFALITATAYALGNTLEVMDNVTFSLLPNIFTIFTIILLAYGLIFDKEKFFIITIFFSLMNFVPIIIYLAKIKISLTLSIIGAVCGAISLTTMLIINKDKLKHIFSSFFHI